MADDGHVVVIASTRRPDIVAATVDNLEAQTVPADLVVVCVADPNDVPEAVRDRPATKVVLSERGLTVQRNTGVDSIGGVPDLITFIDDDAELEPHYFEHLRTYMGAHPDVVLLTGLVLADGIHVGEIDRTRARQILEGYQPSELARDTRSAYGCNMTVRGWVAAAEPFDERLRLYGWQEDTDFSVRCGRRGRVVHYHNCALVHLAVGSGRVRGRQFGFAQMVNPFYMWRKGTKTNRELLHDWTTYSGANLLKYRVRDRPDREGRLVGNLLGIREIMLHGGRPEAVASIDAR